MRLVSLLSATVLATASGPACTIFVLVDPDRVLVGNFAADRTSREPAPTVANAARILDAARSRDEFATRYSNVFDLRTGTILLFEFSRDSAAITLDLAAELSRGRHGYGLRGLRESRHRR